MERTNDPVRDADHYNREMEERPMRRYEGQIELVVKLDCFGKNQSEAEDYLDEKANELLDIMCLKAVGDVEIETRTKVGDEIK